MTVVILPPLMERIDGCTILTSAGLYVNPLDLQPQDIVIEDVAHALSHQCRYSGHSRDFYSVSEHSCRVARYLLEEGDGADVALWGLLHDASEAYLVDLPRPLKRHPVFGEVYREVEERAMNVIATRFGLDPEEPAAVKHADRVLLATERRDLMPHNGNWTVLDDIAPLRAEIVPWPSSTARTRMLEMFKTLAKAS